MFYTRHIESHWKTIQDSIFFFFFFCSIIFITGWLFHCNIGNLREHKLPLHSPVLWSDSYVIRTASNRNKWADPLQCTLKNQPRSSSLAFLWRSTFIPWQRKFDKMILVSNRIWFYQTSINFCNLGFNYQCLRKGSWGFFYFV